MGWYSCRIDALSIATDKQQTKHTHELWDYNGAHTQAYNVVQPEAQLSQRDRATLRVIEYVATSLKNTQGHSKWHPWVWRVSLLAFHCNYVCILIIIIIIILLSFVKFSASNNDLSLKPGLEVTQGHWKWYHSKACVKTHSIVNMAVSCIIINMR